jgi:hypothetical protein
VYFVQVSLFLIGQQDMGNSSAPLALHSLEYCANFTSTHEERNYAAPTTLFAAQATSQSTFISTQFYSIFNRNDKNKQPTLLSQRELALTARNTLFAI